MNLDILKTYMSRQGVPTGSLKVFYSFASGWDHTIYGQAGPNHEVIFNKVYSTGDHFCEGQLLEDRKPGLSVGYSDSPALGAAGGGISGSGYFKGRELVRVGNKVTYDNWTMFLDFGDDVCITGKQVNNFPEILLSSMDGPDAASGFCIGINNANKLFVERVELNERKINTINRELSRFNIISASFSNTTRRLSLTYHDYNNSVNETISFPIKDYAHGNEWYIGGMFNTTGNYTGYSGYVDDFILFDAAINDTSRNSLSEAFFVSQIIPKSTQTTTGLAAFPVNVTINPTGIIGSQVTGTDCVISTTIPQKSGNPITLYKISGLTGVLTGELIEIGSGSGASGSGIIPITVTIPEQKIYNSGEINRHARSFMQFKEDIDDNDVYELYLFNNKKDNLSVRLDFSATQSLGFLDEGYVTNSNVNFFLNGGGQISGVDYFLNGAFVRSREYYNSYDIITYDKIEGEFAKTGFAGVTGDPEVNHVDVVGAKFINKNIYLNSQKLISGLNYKTAPYGTNGNTQRFYAVLASGDLLFEPMASGIDSVVTGNSSEKIQTNSVEEQVWLNGLKQVKNLDYFKVNECSLIDFNKKIPSFANSIYNNEGTYFNI